MYGPKGRCFACKVCCYNYTDNYVPKSKDNTSNTEISDKEKK